MWCSAVGFIVTLTLSLLAAPLVAEAQQSTKVYRIGWLHPGLSRPEPHPSLEAFRQGLREFGYVEGQNLVIEYRFAESRDERLADLAAELVRLKVDVIVAGGTAAIRTAQHATRTIPIVMAGTPDPVGARVRHQPGAPGGEHHRLESPERGAPREAAGDPQGDCAPEYTHRRVGQSSQCMV